MGQKQSQPHQTPKNNKVVTNKKISTRTNMSSGSSISSTVSLGAGCYWGTEKYIKVNFQKLFPDSIKSASVGL